MKDTISALMDGELQGQDAGGALQALAGEGEAREAWRLYHLIGDVMNDGRLLSAGFSQRVAARLAVEPTVVAPRAALRAERRLPWPALSAAASVAAVALVGWVAFGPLQNAPAPEAAATGPDRVLAESETAQVPPPPSATEYLLAHQGYSPLNSLQGMAPYVRSVSSEREARKQ